MPAPWSERVRGKIARDMDGELRTDRAPRERWRMTCAACATCMIVVAEPGPDPEWATCAPPCCAGGWCTPSTAR